MNNRLQQFLELENLTPARLADTLGVQRSGLSHILSGCPSVTDSEVNNTFFILKIPFILIPKSILTEH